MTKPTYVDWPGRRAGTIGHPPGILDNVLVQYFVGQENICEIRLKNRKRLPCVQTIMKAFLFVAIQSTDAPGLFCPPPPPPTPGQISKNTQLTESHRFSEFWMWGSICGSG